MDPVSKYFIAKISTDFEDEDTGRLKVRKEEKLVFAVSPTDVEAKITKLLEGTREEWRITAILESKINEVVD
jgi:hypothetical protein